jgi:uncharacterized protein (DUF302 family)
MSIQKTQLLQPVVRGEGSTPPPLPHSLVKPPFKRFVWQKMLGIPGIRKKSPGPTRLLRELDRGETEHSRPSLQAVAIAFFLALVGLAMAIYLVSIRSSTSSQFVTREEISMTPSSGTGIINKPSNHSVDQTVEKLKGILAAKGVTLFTLVDHSGEAEKAGMKMPPTKLLIFGSPKAGTPLMLAAPSIAIDLPLKILVWEDAQGKVWVSYNSAAYLQERHGVPQELLQNIAVVETLAAKAGE